MIKLTHRKLSNKLLLLGLIVCMALFLVNSVSAMEWDNIKNYDSTSKTVTIKNALGFGADIAKITLDTPIDNKVGFGYNKVAQFTITQYADYNNALKELELFDKKNGMNKFLRDYDYKYLTYEDIEVNEYKDVCGIVNGSSYCEQEISGSHIEQREKWIKLNQADLKKSESIVIGIFTEVEKGDSVEWIPNIMGIRIEEWATWTYALSTDLVAYYAFEEGTGITAADSSGNGHTLDGVNTPGWTTSGKIGNAADLENSSSEYWDNDDGELMMNGSMTINAWLKKESYNPYMAGVSKTIKSSNGDVRYLIGGHTDSTTTRFNTRYPGGSKQITATDLGLGEWYMATLVINSTGVSAYINSTIVGYIVNDTALAVPTEVNPFFIGAMEENGVKYFWDGMIDEVGIWDRALSTSEISDLWNGSLGLTYSIGENYITYDETNYSTTCSNPVINYPAEGETVGIVDEITINYSCGATDYTFNITLTENKTLTVVNATSSREVSWNYKLFQTTEYFVASTTSGATNPFNITFDSNSQITIAYLNYNNTAVLGSISNVGSIYVLSRDQLATGASSTTNIPFFWNITRADGFSYATTSQNQSVSSIVINETCTGMYSIVNLTLVDELTQAKINETALNSSIKTYLTLYTSDGETELSSFSHEYTSTNPAAICIDNNLSNGETYLLNLQVQYKTDNHSEELYHIEDYTLDSSSLYQNITLYDLPNDNTQKFELLTRDTSYIPIEGALIKIDRKYIENGSFYTTEIPKTDAKGVTSASLETDDVIYNFYIYDNGVLISTFTNVLAICQTPLVSTCSIDFNAFQTGISIPDYELGSDFNFTLGYNSTSKIVSSSFTIPSGEPSTVMLEVIREDTLGTAVCEDTLTSASGTLTCVVPASFGNSSVLAKIYKTGVEQGRGNIKLDQSSSDIFGPILIMLSVLVLLTLIGIGISDNPVVSAVFLFVGVLLLFAMNLVQSTGFYGKGATILFLGLAIILVIIKAARRT